MAKIEAINRHNTCVDRVADLGAMLVVICVLASFLTFGGWVIWVLVNELAHSNVRSIIDVLTGLGMLRP